MYCYLNGEFVPEEEATVSVFDRGFLYGDGLFETMRVYRGQTFALGRHLDRLVRGASLLRLGLPDRTLLNRTIGLVIEKNQLWDALVRLAVTRGRGGHPTVVITAREFTGHPAKWRLEGMRIAVCLGPIAPHPFLARVKSINRLPYIMARAQVSPDEADEVILTDGNRRLAEGTFTNLFTVRDGVLHTPSPETGVLPGVTRAIVLELAAEAGCTCEETVLPVTVLENADEVFLTSSGLEVCPVSTVNGRSLRKPTPGPITSRLMQLYREKVAAECGGETD